MADGATPGGRRSRGTALLLGAGVAGLLLWGAELALFGLHPDPYRVARARAQAEGRAVDLRRRAEVVADLRRAGRAAVPRIVPASLLVPGNDGRLRSRLDSDGEELLPLSGIGSRTTVLCAEAGPYAIFESDPHGLRNPPEVWSRTPIELALVGDSFTLGECVADDETIAATLRRDWPATVNLGYPGHSPLFELGSLVEYGPALRPQTTLWFFFENDLSWFDLERSAKSPLLMRYREPGFSQRLFERRAEIDARLEALVDGNLAGVDPDVAPERVGRVSLESILRLERLRRTLGRLRRGSGAEAAAVPLDLFEEILARAQRVTSDWGGQLVVVYLPGVWRYASEGGMPGWAGPHVRDGVRDVAHRLGLGFIDVSEAFAEHEDPLSLFAFPGPSHLAPGPHMNAAGYRYSAAVVAEALALRGSAADSTRRSQISRQ